MARTTVRDNKELMRWLARPESGPVVTYHIGNLGADRAVSPVLHNLAESVLILAERGALTTLQRTIRLSMGAFTIYSAARADYHKAPRSLMLAQIDAHTWRALQAVAERHASQSSIRAICGRLGCHESYAADLLSLMLKKGLVERAEGKTYKISAAGRRALL